MRWVVLLAMVAATSPGVGNTSQENASELTLRASTRARAFKPGEVVLVTVTPSRPVSALAGEAFDHAVGFWSTNDSSELRALVGIPLDTVVGSYDIALHATTADGAKAIHRIPLKIARAQFATRQLRVADRFVNPPASMTERITREGRVMADLFAKPRSGRLWHGPFSLPVPGPATSSFGRLSTLNGVSRGRHLGADFRAADGTPIHAPNAGEVVLVGEHYFSGNTVVLDHGDELFSVFAHLSKVAVKVGSVVSRGDWLGDAGATGRVTGPHLHWAVRLRGISVDPLSLVAVVADLGE